MTLHTLPRRLLWGNFSSLEIAREVERRWRANDFVHHLGRAVVPVLPSSVRRVKRYGLSANLTTDILYGEEGRAGGMLITTPMQRAIDETFTSFVVPPHTHRSPHIALITEGEAVVLIARSLAGELRLIVEPVRAGTLIFFRALVPHTFVSAHEFQVASVHAEYIEPDRADFTGPSDVGFGTLPRMSYEEFRKATAA